MKFVFFALVLFSIPSFADLKIKACMKSLRNEADLIEMSLKFNNEDGVISFHALKGKKELLMTEDKLMTVEENKVPKDIKNAQTVIAIANLEHFDLINVSEISKDDVKVYNFVREGDPSDDNLMFAVVVKKAIFIGDTNQYPYFAGSVAPCNEL